MTLDLRPPYVLLEDRLAPGGRARLFRDPAEIVRCDAPEDVPEALARVEAAAAKGLHAAGFIGYEAASALEPRLAPRFRKAATPLVWFGLFPQVEDQPGEALDRAFAELAPPPPLRDLRPAHDLAAHCAKVEEVLAYIAAGDVYQVNLTFPLEFRYDGSTLSLYAALRAAQPSAHGGMASTGEHTILSVSPELFIEVGDGGRITTRPMKGTCARAREPAVDRALARALAADPKQRAENLMIVDLLRNDLSRVTEPGSVHVEALYAVETYPTLHTLTSTISARLRPDAGLGKQMAALFPCGSVVGAPKVRAAEIIAELEAQPRGVYTGAIGAVEPCGRTSFSVAIRTAVIGPDGRGTYGVGGGIVADSEPTAEYEEALLKGRVLSDLAGEYGLIETLRWTPGDDFVRLDEHLERMRRSARQLGFTFDRPVVAAALARASEAWPRPGPDRRVRAVLARDGALGVTSAILEATPARLLVGVATLRLDAADPFLRHKTTRRAIHDHAFDEAAAEGFDEALLLNREGRIADASRNSVFLERGGRLLTPPLTDGALPGILRAELIAQGRAVENALTPADLTGRWFLGNSLRGLRPAKPLAPYVAPATRPAA